MGQSTKLAWCDHAHPVKWVELVWNVAARLGPSKLPAIPALGRK